MIFRAELKLECDIDDKVTDTVLVVADSYADAVKLIEESTFDCLSSINRIEAISPSNYVSISNKDLYDKVIRDIEENSIW